MNEAAEKLLKRSDTTGLVQIRGHRVIGLGHRSIPSLESAFNLARINPCQPVSVAFVHMPRSPGQTTGSARLVKLPHARTQHLCLGNHDRYMLIIDLTAYPPQESLRTFGHLFDLTPAEIRVLSLLVEDSSPNQIAEQLGIGLPTVRTHLQRIRQKTGTHRFSDLTRLVFSTCRNL